jgi:membrane-bound inhibitor of C-type lysozyme
MLRGTAAVGTGSSFTPGGLSAGGLVKVYGGPALPLTGTQTQTAITTINVPAGLMNSTGALRLTTLWSATSLNANLKTARVLVGGTNVMAISLTSVLSLQDVRMIYANNSTSLQKYQNGATVFGTQGAAAATSTVDTTTQWSISLIGTLGSTTDTMNLEAYALEYMPGG